MSDNNQGLTCPVTGCPVKNILIMTAAVFVVTFGFDFLYHGVFLKADYEATANLWRSQTEMQAMMGISLLYHAVLALGVGSLYGLVTKNSPCCGACAKTGLKFGFLIGLTVGILMFANYIWVPMPLDLAIKWLVGSLAWGIVTGYVLSLVSGKCCCKK
ncbi:MAG: hypothetical protein EBQ96_09300 [Proteobacteria bacterium]|nr:hypothetical protein [Pseudomonadota bacterium]